MEEQFSTILEPGEELLWCGRPEAFVTLDQTNKNSIVTGTCIKALVGLAVIGGYLAAVAGKGNSSIGVLVCLLAITGFAIAMPFVTASHLRKKIVYGLSNRRLLHVGFTEGGVPYGRIRKAALRTDADGHVSLLCGPHALRLRSSRWRSNAEGTFTDDPEEKQCTCAVLYALPMSGELELILRDKLPLDD